MSNNNFNLNEWVGKGEKNLLNEGRDDDDFMTTISPEEQGVDPADATRETSLEEDDLYEGSFDDLLNDLFTTKGKQEVEKVRQMPKDEQMSWWKKLKISVFGPE